jgi:hypothetical protein
MTYEEVKRLQVGDIIEPSQEAIIKWPRMLTAGCGVVVTAGTTRVKWDNYYVGLSKSPHAEYIQLVEDNKSLEDYL